jgi:cytochrome c oxidase subunit 2
MRDDEGIKEKVANINKIREAKSALLVKEGKVALDPYTFDYLLLCNKICGASHYNMQMKIVVDEPADFKKWIAEKSATTIAQAVKADAEQKAKEAAENLAPKKLIVKDTATTTVDTSIIVETPVAIK